MKRQSSLLGSFLVAIAVLVFCNVGSITVVSADDDCTPGVDEVALFSDESFKGPCVIRGIGEYQVLRDLGFLGISSIKVGANVEALVCGPGLTGCSFAYQDSKTFQNTRVVSVNSMIVRLKNQPPECRPGDNQVALWKYEYWFGKCKVVSVGDYARDPWGSRPPIFPLSLRVGSNVSATLCSRDSFKADCLTLLPGYYNHWDYTGTNHHQVRSLAVQPKDRQPDCLPNASQVAVFRFARYFGPCRVFDLGQSSLNETLSWAAGLQNWEGLAHSFRIGANVQATFCWTVDTDGRGAFQTCAQPLSIDVPQGFRKLMPSEHVSLTVQDRGASPPASDRRLRRERGNAPPAVSANDFTLQLAPNVPFQGYPWWTGRYPTIGSLDGNLSRVSNARNSVWLGFLKLGFGSVDCGNPDAYVYLGPGQSMTEDQMITVFGSRSPALPVQFVACSGAVGQQTAGGGLSFPALPLNITYTRQR